MGECLGLPGKGKWKRFREWTDGTGGDGDMSDQVDRAKLGEY